MLRQSCSHRRNHQRRLARTRARGVNSCADSKPKHSCKPLSQSCRSLGKSRTANITPSNNVAVRYHRTNQYSITALTDAFGAIVERYAYDAYGGLSIFDGSGTARTSTAESNRYTYTGREWDDDLDLYHYRARMYDPVPGQFLGRDPIGFYGSRWNVYRYVSSRPVIAVDPEGTLEIIPVQPVKPGRWVKVTRCGVVVVHIVKKHPYVAAGCATAAGSGYVGQVYVKPVCTDIWYWIFDSDRGHLPPPTIDPYPLPKPTPKPDPKPEPDQVDPYPEEYPRECWDQYNEDADLCDELTDPEKITECLDWAYKKLLQCTVDKGWPNPDPQYPEIKPSK